MTPLVLWEHQKKRVCEYHECSDGWDRQYPECDFDPRKKWDCPLQRIQGLLEYLNEPVEKDCYPNEYTDSYDGKEEEE